jgi:hypothetical protein
MSDALVWHNLSVLSYSATKLYPCKVILWSIVVPAYVCIFLCSEIFFVLNDLTIEGQKRNWIRLHQDFRLRVVAAAYLLYAYVYIYIYIVHIHVHTCICLRACGL